MTSLNRGALERLLQAECDSKGMPDAIGVDDAEAEALRHRAIDEDDAWLILDAIHTEPLLAWRLGLQMLRVATSEQQLLAAGTIVFEDLLQADHTEVTAAVGPEFRRNARLRRALGVANSEHFAPAVVEALLDAYGTLGTR